MVYMNKNKAIEDKLNLSYMQAKLDAKPVCI